HLHADAHADANAAAHRMIVALGSLAHLTSLTVHNGWFFTNQALRQLLSCSVDLKQQLRRLDLSMSAVHDAGIVSDCEELEELALADLRQPLANAHCLPVSLRELTLSGTVLTDDVCSSLT